MRDIFQKRSLNNHTLGELLRLRREEQTLSRAQAADKARVKVAYITALEETAYEALPEGLYAKHVLRAYCACLQLSYAKMLTYYEREQRARVPVSGAMLFGRERVRRRYFFLLPKVWRGSILVVAIFAGFVYIGLRVLAVIAPPPLTVSFPPEHYVTSEHTITIQGTVSAPARLFINASEVVVPQTGVFEQTIDLKSGMNDIVIRAQKKYGRDAHVPRHILVQ